MSPLSPEARKLDAALDKLFAAEDREIAKEVKREREVDEARAAMGLPPVKRKRDIRAFEGFASGGATGRTKSAAR